jgi:hypothetical protein
VSYSDWKEGTWSVSSCDSSLGLSLGNVLSFNSEGSGISVEGRQNPWGSGCTYPSAAEAKVTYNGVLYTITRTEAGLTCTCRDSVSSLLSVNGILSLAGAVALGMAVGQIADVSATETFLIATATALGGAVIQYLIQPDSGSGASWTAEDGSTGSGLTGTREDPVLAEG